MIILKTISAEPAAHRINLTRCLFSRGPALGWRMTRANALGAAYTAVWVNIRFVRKSYTEK